MPALPPLRAQRKYLEDYRGIVAELQLLHATMEFKKGTYLSVSAALQAMNAEQAQNKIAMQLWLQSLGVDLDNIRIKSFVHMHLITSKLIWTRMCERCPNDAKKALSVFLSRRWESEDLLECVSSYLTLEIL